MAYNSPAPNFHNWTHFVDGFRKTRQMLENFVCYSRDEPGLNPNYVWILHDGDVSGQKHCRYYRARQRTE
ncbi:hypothetical protein IKD98_02290 [Candidatus Saccharibacteria bacterium]|nr:hypothetical protein [Candidatus Saccharibacteria bacterium]